MSRQRGEIACFAAGVLSATIVWSLSLAVSRIYCSSRLRDESKLNSDDDTDDDNESSSNTTSTSSDNISPSQGRKSLVRWPWDKLRKTVRKSVINSVSFLNLGIANYDDDDSSAVTANNIKTGPCIGEIFGLDVGGTLTKLVYFEQQIREYKRQTSHEEGLNRREHYNVAASALEVLQVRRSHSMAIAHHSTDSDTDLQGLWGIRQESVPDRLNEYSSSCHIDIGAPLSPDRDSTQSDKEQQNINGHNNNHQQESNSSGMGMRKSLSMVNMSKSTEHAEALDNFYSFARRLDSYETAVKDKHLTYYSRYLNGTFHFIRYETRRMNHAMNLMRYNNFHRNIKEIGATGGGAHKYADDWQKELGITMAKQNEMDSLVAGMQFVMQDIVGECYTFKPCDWTPHSSSPKENEPNTGIPNGALRKTPSRIIKGQMPVDEDVLDLSDKERRNHESEIDANDSLHRVDSSNSETNNRPRVDQWWTSKKVQRDNVTASDLYPYLLVSIGTGVSILRVDGPRKHERISGSTIGGGTYWGLCRLLTGSDSFSDVLDLAMKGDPSKVDMMVGKLSLEMAHLYVYFHSHY